MQNARKTGKHVLKTHGQEPEGEAISGVKLWLVLMKAHQAIAAFAAQSMKRAALGESDFRVLEVLLHKGGMSVNEIGPKVFLTPGSISVAVDRLHRQGLVSREEDRDDRRVKQVALTPKGRALITDVFAEHAREMNELASELSQKDRRRIVQGLKSLGKRAAAESRPGRTAKTGS